MRTAIVLVGILAAAGAPGCGPADPDVVRVGAAASLRDVLTEAAGAYEREHAGTRVRLEFAASSTIARQIESGAELDVFVSADRDLVDRVAARLDPASIGEVLGNVLCIVARPGLEPAPSSPVDLARVPGRVAVAGSGAPAGKHARALFTRLALVDALAPKLVEADDVRAALALVESGAADAGVVYLTDAAAAKSARLVWVEPSDVPTVVYVAGTRRDADERAAGFARWLRSPEFLRIANKHGFSSPATQAK